MNNTRNVIRRMLTEDYEGPDWDALLQELEDSEHFAEPVIQKHGSTLVHFAESVPTQHGVRVVDSIADHGFYGTPDVDRLFRTAGLRKSERGWNFGVSMEEAENEYPAFMRNYGNDAVIFNVPKSVYVTHVGDSEDIHVFWGEDATDLVPVHQTDSGYEVEGRTYPNFESVIEEYLGE